MVKIEGEDGLTEFIIVPNNDEFDVIVKRNGLILNECHAVSKKEAEFERVNFINQFWNKPMRYALRNKDKINAILGYDTLNRINKSLKEAFSVYRNMGQLIKSIDGEPYPILLIDDAGSSFGMISFYVIKKEYDIYSLAFKEFMG